MYNPIFRTKHTADLRVHSLPRGRGGEAHAAVRQGLGRSQSEGACGAQREGVREQVRL